MNKLDRPYECNICGFRGLGRDVVIHVQQVHPEIWELTEMLDEAAAS